MSSHLTILPAGAVEQLLRAMEREALEGARAPQLRQLVARAAEQLREDGKRPEGLELFRECYTLALRGFRFVPDPAGEELLQPAAVTLEQGVGDCDDATVLVLALARACGLNGRIVILSRELVTGDLEALHAYAEVEHAAGQYLAADLGGYRAVGEEPPAPVAAVRHEHPLPPLDAPGVGFLDGLINGIFGLASSKNQRKAAEAQANALIEEQRLENAGLLDLAREQRATVALQGQALTKAELIRGAVRAQELRARDTLTKRILGALSDLAPYATVAALALALGPALLSLRAPRAVHAPSLPASAASERRRRSPSRNRAARKGGRRGA